MTLGWSIKKDRTLKDSKRDNRNVLGRQVDGEEEGVTLWYRSLAPGVSLSQGHRPGVPLFFRGKCILGI